MAPPKKLAPEAELAAVRAVAEQLADVEREAARLRVARNAEILAAKLAGATGDQLAKAALIKRQNIHALLTGLGYSADMPESTVAQLISRLRDEVSHGR